MAVSRAVANKTSDEGCRLCDKAAEQAGAAAGRRFPRCL